MGTNAHGKLTGAAIAGGFVLSFLGLGVLWAGAQWSYQLLMFIPFLVLAFAISRAGGNALWTAVGALPMAMLLVQFRDADDSHLMPILVCTTWCLGIVSGHFVGGLRSGGAGNGDRKVSDV